MATASQKRAFAAAYSKAWAAGQAAAAATVPTPMTVVQCADPMNDASPVVQSWDVPDGPCGFAWVVVHPGNSAFANWLKKHHSARAHYQGGASVWIRDYNQSFQRKSAHADAMAKVLRAELGIEQIYAGSRLD